MITEKLPLKNLSEKAFNEQLDGDYPQNGPYYVLGGLTNCQTEDQFYQAIHPEWLLNVDEYVKQKLEPRFNTTWPLEMSDSLRLRIGIINALMVELKTALAARQSLEDIYKLLRRFETEAGIEIDRLAKFEK